MAAESEMRSVKIRRGLGEAVSCTKSKLVCNLQAARERPSRCDHCPFAAAGLVWLSRHLRECEGLWACRGADPRQRDKRSRQVAVVWITGRPRGSSSARVEPSRSRTRNGKPSSAVPCAISRIMCRCGRDPSSVRSTPSASRSRTQLGSSVLVFFTATGSPSSSAANTLHEPPLPLSSRTPTSRVHGKLV